MEEPLHNDQFEDFLKKSFETYRESPSDGLWDKIDRDLGTVTPVAKGYTLMHWLIGSVLIALLGIAGYQQYAFRTAAEGLKTELIKRENEVKEVQATAQKREMAFQVMEQKIQTLEQHIEMIKSTATHRNMTHKVKIEESTSKVDEKSSLIENTLQTISNQASNMSDQQTKIQEVVNNTAFEITADTYQQAAMMKAGFSAMALSALPQRTMSLPLNVEPLTVMPLFQDIDKINYRGKWSLGGQLISMKSEVKVADYEPIQDNPSHGNGIRSFVDTATNSGHTLIAGVTLKYQATPQFTIESGLNYRNSTMYSAHQPSLKFGDGEHHGHGGPGDPWDHDNEYDFSYQLNTSYGSYDIDLRAEQIDSSVQIDEDEPIGLSIKAKNVQESLTIPLLMSYRAGKNRFHIDFKVGLMANLLLRNRFEIEDIMFNDIHFKAPENMEHSGAPKDHLCLSLDYIAGIGVGYDITDALTLNVMPVVSGSLLNRNYGAVKSSEFSAGISTGISYRF